MLRCAARYADNWNSYSLAGSLEAQLEETRSRCQRIDELCLATGRDPAALRRSYLLLDMGARTSGGLFSYYRLPEAFAEVAQGLIDVGISEIGLYYPMREEQVPTFERIACEVIPALRAQHAA